LRIGRAAKRVRSKHCEVVYCFGSLDTQHDPLCNEPCMPDDPTRLEGARRPIASSWPAPTGDETTFHRVWINIGAFASNAAHATSEAR
jgi:hypothetical protein